MANIASINVKITDHCNYNCIACNTFSPIAKAGEYGLLEYEKDLKRISELFKKVNTFKILGGGSPCCPTRSMST